MPTFVDITSQRFGRLVVICVSSRGHAHGVLWSCVCDCGNGIEVSSSALRSGRKKSCGCLYRDTRNGRSLTHGHARRGQHSKTYNSWWAMHNRCTNSNHAAFKYYGGRGITLCDRWRIFENFLSDMGPRPDGHSIERIDVDDNYEPGNCIWIPIADQGKNKRKRQPQSSVL